jgi:hypothetical protein
MTEDSNTSGITISMRTIYILIILSIVVIGLIYYFRDSDVIWKVKNKVLEQCPTCPTCTNLIGLRSMNLNITWPIIAEQELLGVWEGKINDKLRYIVDFYTNEYASMKTDNEGKISLPITGLVHTNAILVANDQINKMIYEDKPKRLNVINVLNTYKRIDTNIMNVPEIKNPKSKYEGNWIAPYSNTILSINDGKASIGKNNENSFMLDTILPYIEDSMNKNVITLQPLATDFSKLAGFKLLYNPFDDTFNMVSLELTKKN